MNRTSASARPALYLLLLICLFISYNQDINAQNVELSAGAVYHSFFDLQEQNPHFQSNYQSEFGHSISMGISRIKYKYLTLALSVDYNSYGGTLSVTDGGLGGEFTTEGSITKSTLGVTLYPLCLSLPKKLEFRLGLIASFLLDEKFEGTRSVWIMNSPSWSLPFTNEDTDWSSKTTWAAKGLLLYPIQLSEVWSLIAEYRFCLGLSGEFSTFTEETRSMKHELLFGIRKIF
jgi:hypothetical protein